MFEPGTIRSFEVTPQLMKASRGLLGWTQGELAGRAGVGISTLTDFERGARVTHHLILKRLCEVLEGAGIRFVYGPREIGVLQQR